MRPRVARRAGGLAAWLVTAALLAGCGAFSDVSDVVADNYKRAASQDTGTAKAYAAGGSPSSVARSIASKEKPLDTLSVAGNEYLQYDDYLVRVQPGGGGSTVLLDNYNNGYQRWVSDVGQQWGSQSSGDGGPGDEGK